MLEMEAQQVGNELSNRLTKRSIGVDLDAFNHVTVEAPQAGPEGFIGPMPPRILTIRAAYFINTDTAVEHFKDERATEGFEGIKTALRKQGATTLIEGGGKTRASGRAVELGKATLRLFCSTTASAPIR